MIRRRSTIRWLAKWALGAMLLAQVAVAAQACVMPAFRPASAFPGSGANPACEDEPQPVDVLCLAQCLQADQAVASPHDSNNLGLSQILLRLVPSTCLRRAVHSGHAPSPACIGRNFFLRVLPPFRDLGQAIPTSCAMRGDASGSTETNKLVGRCSGSP